MQNGMRGPLPVKVDATSNGEFRPVPLTEQLARANNEAELRISEHAKRVGLGRRAFLQSLCGAATTLLTLNEAFAALGNTGGLFHLPTEGAFEPAAAAEALAGDEFIFDVQTHMVDPAGHWRSNAGRYWEQILANFPQGPAATRTRSTAFPPSNSSSTYSWTAIPISQCSRLSLNCQKATHFRSKRQIECEFWSTGCRAPTGSFSMPWWCRMLAQKWHRSGS